MKNQKGFAPILIILIGVVILGAVGSVLISKNKTGGNPLSQLKIGGAALNANCDFKDPDLCKYINRAMTGDHFKNGMVISTITTDKNGKKRNLFEIDENQNSKMTSSQDGKEIMSLINLGEMTYTKDYTDGKWWKYESKRSGETETSTQGKVDVKEEMKKYTEEYKDKTSYKKIGKETCGTLTCFKYQIIVTDMLDYIQYIYFDDKEYLIRKTRTEDKNGMTTETSYEYKTVTIKEPSPIKEGNPYDNILNQEKTGISEEKLKTIQEQIQQNQGETTETEE